MNIDYNGTTFGGGITLAGGYKDFFVSLDGNYTYSNIDVADGEIKTYTISPRVGLLVDSAVIPGDPWPFGSVACTCDINRRSPMTST